MSESEGGGCFKMTVIEYHDFKTLMGPCFVSFSIPLLVPGVVLTIVGSYGNEHTFPTFGGWHIAGIVILVIAVVMLLVGIVLKCCYQPIISADIEHNLSPTSSMIAGSTNLGFEKDGDPECSSNGSRGTRKVAHFDLGSNHRFVSTHDGKGSNSNFSDKFLPPNGVLKDAKNDTSKYPNKQSPNDSHSNNSNTGAKDISDKALFKNTQRKTSKKDLSIQSTSLNIKVDDGQQSSDPRNSSNEPMPEAPPPSYEDVQSKKGRRTENEDNAQSCADNQLRSTTDAAHGSTKTTVTVSITAEAETTSHTTFRNKPRDHSSDTNENSEFLPEIKRRKKKKRKRRRSSSGNTSDISVSTREEPPELPVKPVLIHDGSPHHHHNQHVHFQADPESEYHQVNKAQDFDAIETE